MFVCAAAAFGDDEDCPKAVCKNIVKTEIADIGELIIREEY